MEQTSPLLMVITTVSSEKDGEQLAGVLVEESLAACVQIDGPVSSLYRWDGKLQRTSEYRLSIKTAIQNWPKLRERIAKLHPYDEPEIIAVPISHSSQGYADWVIDQTT